MSFFDPVAGPVGMSRVFNYDDRTPDLVKALLDLIEAATTWLRPTFGCVHNVTHGGYSLLARKDKTDTQNRARDLNG
jgi:hypothetical protein